MGKVTGWWRLLPGVFFGGTYEQYLDLKGDYMESKGKAKASGSLTVIKPPTRSGAMMRCGHAANGIRDGDPNKPCCVICDPPEAYEVAPTPDLAGRKARCAYYGTMFKQGPAIGANECAICKKRTDHVCHCERPSNTNLPFFEYQPDKPFDKFYCGCAGWG
jgi:hypothetical protein